ncbi:MAG TPA: winged helix-turn-helix transcriptional regulator [Geobacteraceae bacterium]
MNNEDVKSADTYRSYLLMEEIARQEPLTQRDLSRKLDIALGLVNSYLKNLVAKGYVRIKAFPRNRYAYILTPEGIAEKSRLAYQHLSYFTNLYRIARQDYAALFLAEAACGVRSVSFCGVDEVAEIAYLSLKETGIDLSVVMDDERAGERFFDTTICAIAEGVSSGAERIVITSFKRREALRERLLELGVAASRICAAGEDGEKKV